MSAFGGKADIQKCRGNVLTQAGHRPVAERPVPELTFGPFQTSLEHGAV